MMPQHYTARDRETGRKSRSGPLATANGYRPADGWGVVIQAWRPGKTGNFNRMGIGRFRDSRDMGVWRLDRSR